MNGVDISSWLLIEDSADSEEDSGIFSLYPSTAFISGHNEDDAESCNYDTDGKCGLSEFDDDHDFGDDNIESDSGDSIMWLPSTTLECFSSLPVKDEDDEMKMGEVNVHDLEDRLFWEVCMEVGYP